MRQISTRKGIRERERERESSGKSQFRIVRQISTRKGIRERERERERESSRNVFVSVGEGRDAVFENVALRIQWRECDFPHRLTVNLMLMTSQAGHVASVDLLAEQAIAVVIVGDGVAQDRAVNSLRSPVTSLSGVRIHFAPQADELSQKLNMENLPLSILTMYYRCSISQKADRIGSQSAVSMIMLLCLIALVGLFLKWKSVTASRISRNTF